MSGFSTLKDRYVALVKAELTCMSVSDDERIGWGWGLDQYAGQRFVEAFEDEECVSFSVKNFPDTDVTRRRWLAYLHKRIFEREVAAMCRIELAGLADDENVTRPLFCRYQSLVRKEMRVMPVEDGEIVPDGPIIRIGYTSLTFAELCRDERLLRHVLDVIPDDTDPKFRRLFAYISQHLAGRERAVGASSGSDGAHASHERPVPQSAAGRDGAVGGGSDEVPPVAAQRAAVAREAATVVGEDGKRHKIS